MSNQIPVRQNLPEFINRLAASSRAYDIVKSTSKWQTASAIFVAILGPVVSFTYPDARGWVALCAVAILLADLLFFEPRVKRNQELGAKIQEVFDTYLLELPWNSHRVGSPPDHEEISSLAESFKTKGSTDRLLNWYPPAAGDIPLEYGRFVCQRANMRWDMALRRYFGGLFVALIALLVLLVCSAALALKWDASQIAVSLILPVMPIAVKLLRESRKHFDSAATSERAKNLLESIWQAALQGGSSSDQLREDSRRLQDELYDRRKGSPTVPQWLYLWLKPNYERDMHFATAEMVKQVQANGASS